MLIFPLLAPPNAAVTAVAAETSETLGAGELALCDDTLNPATLRQKKRQFRAAL